MINWDSNTDILKYRNRWYVRTPLSYSCVLSNLEIIIFLINLGADVNYADGCAFSCVCDINNDEIVNYFLQSNLSQNTFVNVLITGCPSKNINMIEFIIHHGCDIKIYANKICNILARNGDKEIHEMIQYLINRGLVLNSDEPLLSACRYHNIPLIKFYLENDLNVDGDIILEILKTFNIHIIKLFLDHRVYFSQLDNSLNEFDEILGELEQNGLNIHSFVSYFLCRKHI
jgi:ankyrin repeat protein